MNSTTTIAMHNIAAPYWGIVFWQNLMWFNPMTLEYDLLADQIITTAQGAYEYRISGKSQDKEQRPPDGLIQAAQDVIDEFLERIYWRGADRWFSITVLPYLESWDEGLAWVHDHPPIIA